jgi:sigma-E factor negative regulatory protein RseA
MNDTPQSDANDEMGRRADLSALMDGHAGAGELQRCGAAWRDDPQTRSTWHAYHLIGDVLRSDELAGSPARDAALLAALRRRLADEPTVLAPAALPTPRVSAAGPGGAGPRPGAGVFAVAGQRRRTWLMPSAVAAGFVAVAGVLVVSRMSATEPAAPSVLSSNPPAVLAGNPPAPSDLQRVGGLPASGTTLVLDGQLIRDAQLDAYLRAHREMRGSAAAAVPGGAMRSVETIVPQR